MRIEGQRQSDNVEDRRGMGSRRGPVMLGGGIGSILLIALAILFGADPMQVLNPGQNPGAGGPQQVGRVDPAQEELKKFVSVVLADTEDVWNEQFRLMGRQYREPKLVLFSGSVDSACGFADAAVGPFYCPGDQKVYIDLSFYDELKRRFGAPGDFAQAYVVAHEIGHHVQQLLGTSAQVETRRRAVGNVEANRLSVRLELQADYYAGVWAHHGQRQRKFLEPGDIDEAIRAADAIGDDTIQRQARGRVVPDSFTHGRSDQRIRWFKKGFASGDPAGGDTFSVPYEAL
jgi:predicted metalloprotease